MSRPPTPWPDITAFDRAVQSSAFPPKSRLGAAVVDRSAGLTRRMEGANAAAYVLKAPEGELVLRCFKDRPAPALQRRYEALTRWAAAQGRDEDRRRPPVLADAMWLPEAVNIEGRWWPAVVMEHVAGRSLRAHLESRLDRPEELNRLAEGWLGVLDHLDRNDLAHGDLQHDNIRVTDGGGLRLIDLDAVWLTELSKDPPQEFGHPHFQHPERLQAHHWNRNIDRFSALVIHLSILAVAADPGLWDEFHNEDNLLFTAEDFARPMACPLWFRLAASRSLHVRKLTALLDRACRASLDEVPALEALTDVGLPTAEPEPVGDRWPMKRLPDPMPDRRPEPEPEPDLRRKPERRPEPVGSPDRKPDRRPEPVGSPDRKRASRPGSRPSEPVPHLPPRPVRSPRSPVPERARRPRSLLLTGVALVTLLAVVLVMVLGVMS
ncbi:protein kinase domain-containing protein [Streptomyces sp. NPDC001443]